MSLCFFVSDLHGKIDRYKKLFEQIRLQKPKAIFIGGDILPSALFVASANSEIHQDFINGFMVPELEKIKSELKEQYPQIFVILGNDDGKFEEPAMLDAASRGFWEYIHDRKVSFEDFDVYGYSYIPPTPFKLKDWEKYDVSRFVDPGCVSPEDGLHSRPVSANELRYSTIQKDLEELAGKDDLSKAIFLFHSPPYKSKLDRAALDGKMIDYAPLDVHVGSIAIQRFILKRQPLITLHGHVHESARITGSWQEEIGQTQAFSAAHDGPELSLVIFDPENPQQAERLLL